jgi:hypothetical protein
MGKGQSVVRLDRRGQIVEVVRPGDPGYGHWLGMVRPGPQEEQESDEDLATGRKPEGRQI